MDRPDPVRTLFEGARSGDRQAFEELVGLYRERLASLVFFRLGAGLESRTEVEDLLSEVVRRALGSMAQVEWRDEPSVFAWLRGITEQVVLEAQRGQARRDRLREALGSLSADQRRIIFLARVERLPLNEIGLRMRRSPDAVSLLLGKALERLKRNMGEGAAEG
jgi:DNA-directed RNA polymerase specialized sigma24 family protein